MVASTNGSKNSTVKFAKNTKANQTVDNIHSYVIFNLPCQEICTSVSLHHPAWHFWYIEQFLKLKKVIFLKRSNYQSVCFNFHIIHHYIIKH